MKKQLTNKIAAGVAAGCILLSLAGLALANDSKGDLPPRQGKPAMHHRMANPACMEQHLSNSLTKLVAQGTITKDQSDKALSFFKEKAAQRQAAMEKTKDMSPDERRAYMQEHFKNRSNMRDELKKAAGFSDEQAKAVTEALRPQHNAKEMEQRMTNNLKNMVEKGTISQTQADQLAKFFKEKGEQRKAEFEKIKNMTPEERKTYREQNRKDRPNFINEIKAAADLSDDQAKAVAETLRPHKRPCPGGPAV